MTLMKKVRFIAILLAVCLAGYLLGRATSTGDVRGIAGGVHKDIPLFPAPPKADLAIKPDAPPKPDVNVIIETPEEGTRPPGPAFEVSGRAKVGVENVRITVTDSNGSPLYDQVAVVAPAPGGPFGRFVAIVNLVSAPTAPVTLTVTRDAAANETVTRTVLYGQPDQVGLKVYFKNDGMNSDKACELVFPVVRTVSGKIAIYRAAIEALLAGPNADEVSGGYATAIPGSVILKSVAADSSGTVTADFNERLSNGVTGTCRIGALRAQIAATLKQFPEVHDVIISVNGRSENVLQP